MITVDNVNHSQNVSSNRNETLTVACLHSAETIEFRQAFYLCTFVHVLGYCFCQARNGN